MSGHSKFANIKHKKEKNDAKKGKIFTVIGREIVMAVKGWRFGSCTTTANFVMLSRKQKQTTCRTIRSTVVSRRQQVLILQTTTSMLLYEGYGPNGVAIIVETLTDNKNRTAGNVRNAFTKG